MGWIFSRKLPRIINVGFTERAIRIFPHGRREAISKTLRVEANVGYVLQKNDSLGVTGLSCFLKKQCLQAFFKSYKRTKLHIYSRFSITRSLMQFKWSKEESYHDLASFHKNSILHRHISLSACMKRKARWLFTWGKLGVIYQKNDKFMFDNVKIVCHFPWSGHAIPSLPGIAWPLQGSCYSTWKP